MKQTDIKIGNYAINIMPVFFMLITAALCTQFQNTTDAAGETIALASKVQKENADLTRRIAATELRARDAERDKYADNSTSHKGGLNVIIIQPNGSATATPSKSYTDLTTPL